MIKTTTKIILALLLITTLLSCGVPTPRLNPIPPNSTVLALGDSLTYGTGTRPEYSYPSILAELIHHPVINAGVPGEKTKQTLARLRSELKKHKPSLVILCIGGNDLLKKVPKNIIANNITTMIHIIRNQNAQVILIAVPEPKLILNAPDFYQKIATENKVPIDTKLMSKLLSDRKNKSDWIHLNKTGYRLMAIGITKFLKKTGAIPKILTAK